MAALQAYTWLGNIRELRNVLERAVILSDSSTLQVPVGPAVAPAVAPPPSDGSERLRDLGRNSLVSPLRCGRRRPANLSVSWGGDPGELRAGSGGPGYATLPV
jgi:hypothetical protein